MNMLANKPAIDFAIMLLNGPDRGAQFKIISSQISIGRTPENDIALIHDTKCSRKHAVVLLTERGVEIKNVSDRNDLYINGQPVGMAVLQPDDVIKIGKTKLQFKVTGMAAAKSSAPAIRAVPDSPLGVAPAAPRRKSVSDGSNLTFYILAAALVGGLVWLLTSEDGPKKAPTEFRTDKDVRNQIEDNRLLVQQIQSERRQKGYDTRQFEQAQANYIKGFRDFQKGQYERARDYFQTCLSLFPQHQLCNQYLAESQKKFRELIQYYLTLGKDYASKGQYGACVTAYTNVKVMEKDETSKQYQEADSGLKACEAKERGIY